MRQVDKEDFEILYWVFHQTGIPSLISEQRNGRVLHVDDFGDYKVEWHMAGDLKTLKCMYNVSKGALAKSPCLYCMCGAKDLDRRVWGKAPDRHTKDEVFKPVLDIPLSRVHICTLHALCRIIEKLVHLHICFAWTLKPQEESSKAIKEIEGVLSDIGLHGGHVKIVEDNKRSRGGSKIPIKPSIGGVKAKRFLSLRVKNCQIENGSNQNMFNRWKDLHKVVKDHADGGAIHNRKADVWISLDKIFAFMEKKKWSNSDKTLFGSLLDTWKTSFLAAWGDHNVTHYMVIALYRIKNSLF